MVLYNFKSIAVIPNAKEFIDIILSKTQRKTPTVIHNGYAISRIRKFYMRKIKYTQENYREKLNTILQEFPRLDDIHPFYSDLINVLYSRDHYKLALGQLSTAKTLIDHLGQDYLKLLKFADSLYRCKELKRAALGRMCTLVLKLGPSLMYLEQVRQHLSRLPSIDPSTRSILVTGYPNTGKSSFVNIVTNANVEVQPYAFTTKSLFIGHTDYQYMRWQIIDSPGILDHPLEDRNTIEMQAITALAHIHATVLFFLDPSQQCGYSLQQQCSLFHSIKPLFNNKPVLVVCNKQDVLAYKDLDVADQQLIQDLIKGLPNASILHSSNMSTVGVNQVLQQACDLLLAHRVEKKLLSKRVNELMNRIQVTKPMKRDEKLRGPVVPISVLQAKEANARARDGEEQATSVFNKDFRRRVVKPWIDPVTGETRKTEREIELEQGGPGIYSYDLKKRYDLSNDDWKYDVIPEIMDGRNVADFIDADIDSQLAQLEAEEEEQMRAFELKNDQIMADEDSELDEQESEQHASIMRAKALLMSDRKLRRTNNKPVLPRTAKARSTTLNAVAATLQDSGRDASRMRERSLSRVRSRTPLPTLRDSVHDQQSTVVMTRGRKRTRADLEVAAAMDIEADGKALEQGEDEDMPSAKQRALSKLRARSLSRDRSSAHRVASPSPFRDVKQKQQASKLKVLQGERKFNRAALKGESDRHVFDEKPKHLFSGKRGMGKNERR